MANIVEYFPTEILLRIFEHLTVSEKLEARRVSHRWNEIITSYIISPDLQLTVDEKTLKYRSETFENSIGLFQESAIIVNNLKLSGLNFGIPTSSCFLEIGQYLLDLVLSEVNIDEIVLYYCLSNMKSLNNLSLLNCNIQDSSNRMCNDVLLPKLVEIEVDFMKTQRDGQFIWGAHIMSNLLRSNNANLTLKICVKFYTDLEEKNFIIHFGDRLKNLHIEILHPIILEQLHLNDAIKLNELTIVGSTSLDYPGHIREIILQQRNLKKLFIDPKMRRFTIASIHEIQRNLENLEYFAFSSGDRYDDDHIREAINFNENLYHLDLKYRKTALNFVHADQLKELICHPYEINQRAIYMIVRKFSFLKKLSFHINGENNTLAFSSCFTHLQHLEELEIVNESEEHQLNIVLFNNPKNRINVTKKLKKLNIINVNVHLDELRLIYRICPNIEELGFVKYRLSLKDTFDVLSLFAIGLKKLKKICYTHEYHQQKAVPYSARWFVDNCSDLQRVEFIPRVTLDEGSFDGVFEAFYYSLSSISTIRHFYNHACF